MRLQCLDCAGLTGAAATERRIEHVQPFQILAPTIEEFVSDSESDKHLAWLGRAAAAIKRWDIAYTPRVSSVLKNIPFDGYVFCNEVLATLKLILQQAKSDLRAELGRGSVVVAEGQVFEYFDELRKVIETARTDVFFVDPYLDAEFVSRYLPYVAEGVSIRLLGGPKKRATLLPAVDSFAQQSGRPVAVRVSDGLHDRLCLLFIHPRRPEPDRSPICRDYACMISSFVRARSWARPQTQTLSC